MILGFPLALIVPWAFELTPEGLKREKLVDRAKSITPEAEPERAEGVAEQVPAAEPVDREKSIAVLPFVNMSADPEQEYFSDGISEELIHTLSAIEGFHVVGRTSCFFFKGKDVDLRTIGETLGVGNILEGSVRRSGTRLRITAQLISAADGFHLWSNSYDRELTDIFEIQEEIARDIAKALELELGLEVAKSIADRSTDILDAYTWALRGWDMLRRQDVMNLESVREAFEKAIEFDARYLPAYVGSAFASRSIFDWGQGSADDTLADAERRVRQALAMDPDYSRARSELGALLACTGDFAEAEEEFKRALELDPNDLYAHRRYGVALLMTEGRPQEAVALIERVVRADPLDLNAVNNYAAALAQAERVDEAELELRRILEVDPTYSFTYLNLGVVDTWFRNQYASGIHWYKKSFEINPQSAEIPLDMTILFLDLGDAASAERWVEVAERNGAGGYFGDLARFAIHFYRGDQASAETISRRLAETVQTRDEYHYIQYFAWLRLLQRMDPDIARQFYERHYPELFQEEPQVNAWNHATAISLADWMRRSGNDATADSLLEKSLSVIRETTDRYYHPASAAAYLLQGETDRALAALRETVDAGWRYGWWMLEREPIYAPLWDHPEFQAMMAEIKADMAAQLARVREMERNGELEPIPEVSATTH